MKRRLSPFASHLTVCTGAEQKRSDARVATERSDVQRGETVLTARFDGSPQLKQVLDDFRKIVIDRGVEKRIARCVMREQIGGQNFGIEGALFYQPSSEGIEVHATNARMTTGMND